jgi:aminoglycoside N3'-acetyltransferase
MGEFQSNWMAATICATMVSVAQIIINPKGRKRTVSPADFMPKWGEKSEPTEQSVDDMKAVLVGLVKSTGKRKRTK